MEGALKDKLPPWTTGVQIHWDPLRSPWNTLEHQENGLVEACTWPRIPHWLRQLSGATATCVHFQIARTYKVESFMGPERASGRGQRCWSGRKLLHAGNCLTPAGELRWAKARWSQVLIAGAVPFLYKRQGHEG